MQAFEVLRSLETAQIAGKMVKDILDPQKTLLFTDDDAKKIDIWHGDKSPLLLYFLAHRLAKEIKKFTRGFYHIGEIKAPALTPAFLELQVEFQGKILEIINPSAHPEEDGQAIIRAEGKIYLDQDPAWRDRLTHEDLVVFPDQKAADILKETQAMPLEGEYTKDLTFVGTEVYTTAWKLAKFLPDRQIVPFDQFIGTLPEGKFFYPQLTPRIVVKRGKIHAVELYRGKTAQNSDVMPRWAGTIPAPVLFIPRIVHERSIQKLRQAFKMPLTGLSESLDSLLDEKK